MTFPTISNRFSQAVKRTATRGYTPEETDDARKWLNDPVLWKLTALKIQTPAEPLTWGRRMGLGPIGGV
jgi:hypothetical protein